MCIWTGMVICWPFYGKKGAHKAGLILEVAVEASRAIHNLREWARYPARWKKKEGFSSKITIPDFCGKEGHTNEAANAFRAWARSITYYHDYYQDLYLMPLVVASLKGDTADIFDWMRTLDPDNTQDLSTVHQMLREHYCGSLMF